MRITEEQFSSTPIERYEDEENDCTVRTFAYAMGTTYERAHEFMAMVGRKPRRGVSMWIALNRHPEILETEFKKKLELKEFRWNEKYKRKPTLRKLLTELDSGMHIIIVSGHTFAIHENKVVDTYKERAGRRCHTVYKVHNI